MLFKKRLIFCAVSTAIVICLSIFGIYGCSSDTGRSEDEIVSKTKVINGKEYTFTKIINKKGELRTEIRDADNELLKETPVIKKETLRIDPKLMDILSSKSADKGLVKVNIALNFGEVFKDEEPPESGSFEVYDGNVIKQQVNGKDISEKELALKESARRQSLSEMREKRLDIRAELLHNWIEKTNIPKQKSAEETISEGRQSLTLELSRAQIKKLIDSKDSVILGIELWEKGEDYLTSAMSATSISTAAHPYPSTRGNGIGIYMTESGCPEEYRIANYTRLAGDETSHSISTALIIRGVSPDSYLYCRGPSTLPLSTDLDGVGGNPPIYIINRSSGYHSSTSYSTDDRDWDDFVYEELVAAFLAAGNSGDEEGYVCTPGKGLNIITVGNYDEYFGSPKIWEYSSFVDPNTGNDKPEICAPGVSITLDGGVTVTGTSASSAHAAAFAADMMSRSTYLKNRPYLVKAKVLASATDSVTGGYDKVGLGGIDFATGEFYGSQQYYSGGNGYFDTCDSNDGASDGYITKQIYISSSWDKVKVVIAWLNRGTYAYAHTGDYATGMDLDLTVYDPSGTFIGGSYSWDNGFEHAEFSPAVSGYYSFKIHRYANRDTSCNFCLGMYLNYYNE